MMLIFSFQKTRGKRRAPLSETSTETPDNTPTKKTKLENDKPLSEPTLASSCPAPVTNVFYH